MRFINAKRLNAISSKEEIRQNNFFLGDLNFQILFLQKMQRQLHNMSSNIIMLFLISLLFLYICNLLIAIDIFEPFHFIIRVATEDIPVYLSVSLGY